MPLQSYGGYVWSGDPAEPYVGNQILPLGVAAAAGVGLFYASTITMGNGYRPIDYASAATRLLGNTSPFSIGNTFRVPEFLSPFTSNKYKSYVKGVDVTDSGNGFRNGVYTWDASFLKSDSTYDWLKYVTGLSDEDLAASGISRGQKRDDIGYATELIWEESAGGRGRGSLFTIKNGQRQLLSEDIMLMGAHSEFVTPFSEKKGLNRVVAGMFAAADMWKKPGFAAGSVFSRVTGEPGARERSRASFIPIPSVKGRVSSLNDIARRTTYVRGVAAFEMDRFNQLMGGLTEQFFGAEGSKHIKNVLGVGNKVLPGPAVSQFARFGGRAVGLGAIGLAVNELDWVRRQFDEPGQVLASFAVSSGISYTAYKMSVPPKLALGAGIASFAGQMLLPGFDQGLVQGIATTAVNLDWARGSALNPFGYVRRTLEGFAPGITGWEAGALLAVGSMLATGLRMPVVGQRAPVWVAEHLMGRIELGGVDLETIRGISKNTKDIYWDTIAARVGGTKVNTPWERAGLYAQFREMTGDSLKTMQELNVMWTNAEEAHKTLQEANPLNKALLSRLEQVSDKYGGPGIKDRMRKEVFGFVEKAKFSFFGANVAADKQLAENIKRLGFKGPTGWGGMMGGRTATVGLLVFAAHQFFTGGLLGSMQSSEELKDIYSGKQLVEVKKGRWWEGGGTPFEGGRTSFFRPHAYHLMMTRSRQRGIWGEEEDSRSPIMKFFLRNFTYQLEREQYYDRPYPVTGSAFEEIPIIGNVLAGTIGQLIKPSRIMHANEWIRPDGEGGFEFASVFKGSRREPAYSLGAPGPGIPQTPLNPSNVMAEFSYQFRELEGMTGWMKNVIQGRLTGSELFNVDTPILASSARMTDPAKMFWEAELGGMLFTNEVVRRLLPREPYEKRPFNPIRNSMPSWVPDKFKYGDPYRSITWGEARLPGPGFVALHPELEGLDPEDYPLIYQYSILSDVAPYSAEYRRKKKMVYSRRSEGMYTQKEEEYIDAVDARHRKVINQYNFDRVDPNAIQLPGSGITQGLWFSGQSALRSAAAPIEYLTPMGFRPVQKLLYNRDPIEQYEYERLYGTPMSFWDKPWRDWFRPSMYSAMNMLGYEGKPMWRVEADETNAYFDKLEYIKYMQLAQSSYGRDRMRYLWAAGQTRHGVNPQGNPLGIYWSLPAEERKFFNAFAHATGQDRERILEMIPSDQRHIYEGVWSKMDEGGIYAGSPTSIDDQYLASRYASAADDIGAGMPSVDWIGWHDDVDMEDIRVRYVDEIGRDIHDFGLWESTLKKSMGQPFLEGSTVPIHQASPHTMSGRVRGDLYNMLGPSGSDPWISVTSGGTETYSRIDYSDDRSRELYHSVQGYLQ